MARKFYLDDFGLIKTKYEEGYINNGLKVFKNDEEISHHLSRDNDRLLIYFDVEISQHDEFFVVYETGDLAKLSHFNQELDVIVEGYKAQSLF